MKLLLLLFPMILWAQSIAPVPFQTTMKTQRDVVALTGNLAISALDSNYQLGPGDFIGVTFEDNYQTIQVTVDAKIQLEKVTPIDVSNKPFYQVKDEIVEGLSRNYSKNSISVSIVKKRDVYITILGAVTGKGHFSVREGFLATHIYLLLQKFEPDADIPGTILIRKSGDTISLDPSAKFYEKNLNLNPKVQEGDVIYVPYVDLDKPIVYLKEENFYDPVPWRENWTIKRYLYGFQLHRYLSGLEQFTVRRGEETIKVPLKDYDTFVLQEGDYLEPNIVEQVILVGGVVNRAGKIPYQKTLKPIEYVTMAGINGLSQEPDAFKVLRRNGVWEWVDPIEGKLEPGDFIMIEKNKVELAKDYSAITSFFISVITSSLAIYLAAKGL